MTQNGSQKNGFFQQIYKSPIVIMYGIAISVITTNPVEGFHIRRDPGALWKLCSWFPTMDQPKSEI